MKMLDGSQFATQESQERKNISKFISNLADWTFRYTQSKQEHILKRIKMSIEKGVVSLREDELSAEEVGIVALAGMYYKPRIEKYTAQGIKEFSEYQTLLEQYIGFQDLQLLQKFWVDIIATIKPEHNGLIPLLHQHHTQIYALKIAYDRLKGEMGNNPGFVTRAIFGLVCIELMKLHVRLYLIEPLARTNAGKSLDWVIMLDKVFEDFQDLEDPRTSEYYDIGLQSIMNHIKEVRDHVDSLKREKYGISNERKDEVVGKKVKSTNYINLNDQGVVSLIGDIKSAMMRNTSSTQSPPSA